MPPTTNPEFEGDQYMLLYGTLKPGEPRWHVIEDHVEVMMEHHVFGKLRNYKGLFPVFNYDGDDMISMILVRVDTDDVEGFFKMVDEIEGHPHFFKRHKLELLVDDGMNDEIFLWPWVYEGRHPDLVSAPVHHSTIWESDN